MMGAVKPTAPHTTGAGHCNDGWDVLCYADGGPKSKFGIRCADRIHFDCGYDDSSHPNPPSGTYLAGHWNLGSEGNAFLINTKNTVDTISPSAPKNLRVVLPPAPGVASRLQRDPVADQDVFGYMVVRDTEQGKFPIAVVAGTTFTDDGWQPYLSGKMEYRVVAYDASGNFSMPSNTTAQGG